ncbi:D-ribose transporter subunit RbsB [Clostridium carboxidivorans P7]|uniref:Monosaccharide-transporting ATPase n=1 Tax=Clostridium carboxidivorans P7 TaxID=536227 RepID=C6PQA2_9CLOT|nr:ribose ABC transporter substrate-binding protein RbsB [Clostridium carboxidivorans]AKN33065.1 D-ribose transporter subunit RbsB [Clostridium carboxidivorans P7]EET88572.1 Monosaccharide-transporting ATPase [Clostridium carboxidivorans P7]EFG88012.1 periplasmic binding protein and sugar binding domain of the LacI family protein [Clostridium carboxidivorans P7]
MKRTRLKMMSLMLTGALAIAGLTGCGNSNQQQSSNQGGKKKIGMVISTLNNPFFVTMKDGATKKAKELGYDLVVVDSQNDATKERSNVDDLVQQGVSALIINATDSDAVGNSIKVANDKKIPVITVDRQANSGTVVTHIASDNVKGGKMAAEFILQQLGGKANIVELQGQPGASATRDRGKGFHEGVDGKANVKVVASQSADFDRQKGLNVMQNIMQSTPQFDAVFAHNDEMALGAVKALQGKKIIIVGFDGTDDAKKAVANGEMTATVAQQPDLMGSLAIENAVKVIKGESVPKQIPVDLKLIKK